MEAQAGDIVRVTTRWHSSVGEVSVVTDNGFFFKLEGSSHTYAECRQGDVFEIIKRPETIHMAEVENIRKRLSDMTDDELMELIRNKRTLRRQQPHQQPKATTTKVQKARNRMDEVMKQMAAMPPEAKAELLKQLEG